jgi:hypothetical protein
LVPSVDERVRVLVVHRRAVALRRRSTRRRRWLRRGSCISMIGCTRRWRVTAR